MKRREERRTTLFDFIQQEKKLEERAPSRDISEELYQMLKTRRQVSKEEVTKWAKDRGVTTVELIKAIEKLITEKKIKKRLDDEGNLVYEVI
ncbi:conserved hypothetical protein [Pyrobaculum islandicum DSM 4184]|uniref:Uncharacterized protein n=1 Tax=Pyrobaculum islandicum (strain DSM 4184 / JCM 9189 / GEO3) TaxID=384616 RepID=A1RV19_PYRIL|nr:hypothetical protein [Pyrobaculum islandicum]ABL88801.1 conserved hypothetical protein [Pyrobaculum islandicum DSM 4184]